MRMNLITKLSSVPTPGARTLPITLTLRPACGLPGDYEMATTSAALIRLLDLKTDLPASVLRRFEGDMYSVPTAKLLGVELSERVLTEMGYFVD